MTLTTADRRRQASLRERQMLRDDAVADPSGCGECDDTGWTEDDYARGRYSPCFACQPFHGGHGCPDTCNGIHP